MSSIEEEFDDFDVEIDYSYHLECARVEKKLQEVFFQITDYLAQEGRRDLFTELSLSDVGYMIYDAPYLDMIREKDPESMF
jgi:hypothetical protein